MTIGIMLNPILPPFVDRPLASFCQRLTLRWWLSSPAARRANLNLDDFNKVSIANAAREVQSTFTANVASTFSLPLNSHLENTYIKANSEAYSEAYLKALSNPEALAASLKVKTKFAAAHVAHGVLLGPIVLGYCAWLLERCAAAGVTRVFFVSREGATLTRVCRGLIRAMPMSTCGAQPPVITYLPASRLATFLPSLNALCAESLMRLWNQYPKQTFSQLMQNCSLPQDEFMNLAQRHGIKLLATIESLIELGSFFADLDVQIAFIRYRDLARKNLINTLDRKGFFDSQRVAIGDVGWKGSIQTNIERAIAASLLPQGAIPPRVMGLYLALRRDVNHDTSPSTREGFIADEPLGDKPAHKLASSSILRSGSLFEIALSVPHRCVSGYGELQRSGEELCVARAQLLSDTDLMFAKLNARERGIFTGPSKLVRHAFYLAIRQAFANIRAQGKCVSHQTIYIWGIDALRREIVYPTYSSAWAFLEHAHIETFGVFQESRFGFMASWGDICTGRPTHWPHRLRVALEAHFWPEAIVRRSGVPMGNFLFDMALTRKARK